MTDWNLGSLGATATKVYQRLFDSIYSGELAPDEVIREKAKDQEVSQAVVRDALVRLEYIGLVVRRANKETRVINLTREGLADLIEVRIALEQLACRLVYQRFRDPAVYAEAEKLFGEIGASPKADQDFHHFIWDLVPNGLLVRTLKQLSATMFLFAALLRRKGLQRVRDRIRSHRILLDTFNSENLEGLSESDAKAAHEQFLQTIDDVVARHTREAYAGFMESAHQDMKAVAELPDAEDTDKAPPVSVPMTKDEEFLHWIPAAALILDSDCRVAYANEEFERFSGRMVSALVGRQLIDGFWLAVDRIVLDEQKQVLAVQRLNGRQRMTLCFPIQSNERRMVGEIGIDITSMLPHAYDTQSVAIQMHAISPAQNLQSGVPVDEDLLRAFFHDLPAVATWKDRQGRMTWANPEYERVTGLAVEKARGRLPLQNWPDESGQIIMNHDAVVRDRQIPFLTTDQFNFAHGPKYRLTVRFPIFSSALRLEETASLGVDHEYLRWSADMLKNMREGSPPQYREIMLAPRL